MLLVVTKADTGQLGSLVSDLVKALSFHSLELLLRAGFRVVQ